MIGEILWPPESTAPSPRALDNQILSVIQRKTTISDEAFVTGGTDDGYSKKLF